MVATAEENQSNFDIFPKKPRVGLKDYIKTAY